jgi:hypothetical protein
MMDAVQARSLLALAEDVRARLPGVDGRVALDELERRHDELLRSLAWFCDNAVADDGFRLTAALLPFRMATRRLDEGDACLERVLTVPGGDPVRRGYALYGRGYLGFLAGRDADAGALLDAAVAVGREHHDPTLIALALAGLARIALRTDVPAAKRLLEEALAVTEGTADRLGRSTAMLPRPVDDRRRLALWVVREASVKPLTTRRIVARRPRGNGHPDSWGEPRRAALATVKQVPARVRSICPSGGPVARIVIGGGNHGAPADGIGPAIVHT